MFLLFKIIEFLKLKNNNINKLIIHTNVSKLPDFIMQFYNVFFEVIEINTINNSSDNLNLGILLGSIKESENKKIYLAQSDYNNNIPEYLYTNARKRNDFNKVHCKLFRKKILEYFNIETQSNNNAVIINRTSNGRLWENLDLLVQNLKDKKIECTVSNVENLNLKEQIELIHNCKYLILPSGSSQSHLFWVNQNAICIECFIPGQRYINTLLYAKNLNINLYTLFEIFDYTSLNIKDQDFLKILEYQKYNKLVLYSKDITENEINKEIEWFELFLEPKLSKYYCRQYHENIDISAHINKISKII